MTKMEFENLVKHLEKKVGEPMPEDIKRATSDIFRDMDFETAINSLADFNPKDIRNKSKKKMLQELLYNTEDGKEILNDLLSQIMPQLEEQMEAQLREKLRKEMEDKLFKVNLN